MANNALKQKLLIMAASSFGVAALSLAPATASAHCGSCGSDDGAEAAEHSCGGEGEEANCGANCDGSCGGEAGEAAHEGCDCEGGCEGGCDEGCAGGCGGEEAGGCEHGCGGEGAEHGCGGEGSCGGEEAGE